MTPEKIVQNAIIDYVKKLAKEGKKVKFWRREAIGQAYEKGTPDLYGSINGYHVEVECKREAGGMLSPMQEKKKAEYISLGILYISPKSLEEFKEAIKEVLNDESRVKRNHEEK